MRPKYEKILLKLSGEALAGSNKFGLNYEVIGNICREIKNLKNLGVKVSVVVGGGNFWRGKTSGAMDRTRADHIGMLATAMNALAVADVLENMGVDVRVQTAISMREIAEPYIRNRAERHMQKNRVVIFGCGTGNPFFSTDTAASLRAAEIEADIIFKATNVDGVFNKDPKLFPDAVKYEKVSFIEVIDKNLSFIDITAVTMCKDNNIPILVFNLDDAENKVKAAMGEKIGTKEDLL